MAECTNGQVRIALMGGLGNQLFQIFTAVALCLENGSSLKLIEQESGRPFDLYFLGLTPFTSYNVSIRGGNLIFSETTDCKDCEFKVYTESSYAYEKIHFDQGHVTLKGYFQSSLYFINFAAEIRKFIRTSLPDVELKLSNLVHLRIGDYIKLENRKVHPLVKNAYVVSGMNELSEGDKWSAITDSPYLARFLFFPSILRGLEVPFRHSSNLIDFSSMVYSKNLVICNSSYSWWAAFVSDANVVAPLRWFTPRASSVLSTEDLYLESWILL